MSRKLSYPPDLPVSAARGEILDAIRSHQVVVISGATGSGKTTQLPKLCLEAGRGQNGMIGHTQPRRLAARSVASRIAAELGEELGQTVGYQVRFRQSVGENTQIKLMTDGILLAEIQHDPQLRKYDTLIIDEAHERSLNIDFILGYLQRLVQQRPDLLVIITSATIETQRFAAAFGPDTPVIEVEGRTYPVEVRYRPLVEEVTPSERGEDGGSGRGVDGGAAGLPGETPVDQVTGILRAVDELCGEGPGDILVFLAGERDIRDTAQALQGHLGRRFVAPGQRSSQPGAVEVLPLYSRLSEAEQHRIFAPHPHRRVVLATNVAETSLTVPGIMYVIDPGVARISRYSNKTRVQRLPIEAISKASADQRKGRCGRIAPGICIRLYSQADYESRPAYTEPEIQRTSLSAVILQMASLGLGDVADFPFLDPPSARSISDGVLELAQLGALDTRYKPARLTLLGRKLARLPLDPRLARILIEADDLRVLAPALVVVAALAMQDVRERPAEFQAQADQLHARFEDDSSDFVGYLRLWDYLQTQSRQLSGGAFRRLCQREFLHYLRVREWFDLVNQLRDMCREIRINVQRISEIVVDVVDADSLHQALLTGMLSQIGTWSDQNHEYLGAKQTRFVIWPGSGLSRKHHDWVMAAELVETSRVFARTVARIDAEWIEKAARHLVKRSFFDPYWSTRFGAAMIHERVTLFGLTLGADRAHLLASVGDIEVDGTTAPALARELFIRHALLRGEWRETHDFQAENRRAIEAANEARLRRQILAEVDEYVLERWLDTRLPAEITSAQAFNHWWKQQRQSDPQWLCFPWELLVPDGTLAQDFPDFWTQGDLTLSLVYTFAGKRGGEKPGSRGGRHGSKPREVDSYEFPEGVTLLIPESRLEEIEAGGLEWPVPGALEDRLLAWVKHLPKTVRRRIVPAAALVQEITPQMRKYLAQEPTERPPWSQAFAQAVLQARGVELGTSDLEAVASGVEDAMRNHFAVLGRGGKVLGVGDDFAALRDRLIVKSTRAGTRVWKQQEAQKAAASRPQNFAAAVVDQLRLSETRVITRWRGAEAASLAASPYESTAALVEAAQHAAALALLENYAHQHGQVDAENLEQAVEWARDHYEDQVFLTLQAVARAVAQQAQLQAALGQDPGGALSETHAQIRAHIASLLHPQFLSETPPQNLAALERYLRADLIRWEKARQNSARDRQLAAQLLTVRQQYRRAETALNSRPFQAESAAALRQARWMIEEYRVSLFAQQLGTAQKVSPARIDKILLPLISA